MDNNSPTRIKKQASPNAPSMEMDTHNPVSASEDLRRKKMRFLVVCTAIFFLMNLIILGFFIFWIMSGKNEPNPTHTPEAAVVETSVSSEPSKESEETHEEEEKEEEAKEEELEPKPATPQEDKESDESQEELEESEEANESKSDESSNTTLKMTNLATFEDSFFEMFNACSDIDLKERCLFAFLVIRVYVGETSIKLSSWDGFGPDEFIEKFSNEISDSDFAEIVPQDLTDTEKEEKEEELLRIASSVQEKIRQNRQYKKSALGSIPYTFHFEIFTMVKDNPQLKIYLHKALQRFEK